MTFIFTKIRVSFDVRNLKGMFIGVDNGLTLLIYAEKVSKRFSSEQDEITFYICIKLLI